MSIDVSEPAVGPLREAAAVVADAIAQQLADPYAMPGIQPGSSEEQARAFVQRAIDRARFVHHQFTPGARTVTVAVPVEVLSGLVRVAVRRAEEGLALALDPRSVRERSAALGALIALQGEVERLESRQR